MILRSVSEGDETAFRILVQRYSDLLATHIQKITRSREQTEEIVQDVFLKIWQTREALAEVKNFRTWLYVISRNQAISALRKLIREEKAHKEWKVYTANDPLTEDQNKEEQLTLIEQGIEQLPPQQKRAWILSRRQGLKYKEIAEEMELSAETVKKHIQYASLSITKYVETHISIILLGIFLKNHF